MFSRLARYPGADRGRAVPAVVASAVSNDKRGAAKILRGGPRGRPLLVRRWRTNPATGKPVCSWEIASEEATPVWEPVPGWQRGQVFVLIAVSRSRRPATGWLRGAK